MLIGLTTFNHYPFTYLTLKSIEKYTNLEKNRVIVVDNNSTDQTKESIKIDFPWVEFIVNPVDCLATSLNMILDRRKEGEDVVIGPNDVVYTPNWLELLHEDTYKYDSVACGSPYMPINFAYDEIINQPWSESYFKNFYESLRNDPSPEELTNNLDMLYGGDFEKFAYEFTDRNFNEPPFDCSLTHVILYKSFLFDKHNLRYDERYCPYHGGEELDINIQINNLGYYRISSSRVYVHHWLSITDRDRFKDRTEIKNQATYRNTIRLLQKWEFVQGDYSYLEGERPSRVKEWKTPYHKFRLRDSDLDFEIAKKVDGLPFMNIQGKHPGFDDSFRPFIL